MRSFLHLAHVAICLVSAILHDVVYQCLFKQMIQYPLVAVILKA